MAELCRAEGGEAAGGVKEIYLEPTQTARGGGAQYPRNQERGHLKGRGVCSDLSPLWATSRIPLTQGGAGSTLCSL